MEINVRNLKVGYGSKTIVRDFNVDIREGEILTLIGPNGSGKSTLLKAVTGLIPYQAGEVFYDGRELRGWRSKEISRQIAVLPQIHEAPGDFTVEELISYGRMPHQDWFRTDSDEDSRIVKEAMAKTGVTKFARRYIHQLSGGELQRVWLAVTLAQSPRILFLDEPTTYLDIAYQLEMMTLVRQLCDSQGIGIVMVLHDLSQALDVSDRVVVISEGRKYGEGKAEDVINCRMMQDVYKVSCDIVPIADRQRPLIAYRMPHTDCGCGCVCGSREGKPVQAERPSSDSGHCSSGQQNRRPLLRRKFLSRK